MVFGLFMSAIAVVIGVVAIYWGFKLRKLNESKR